MLKLAILASHEGTTLQAVLDACASGVLAMQPVLVVSNNKESGALRRARVAGVPALHMMGSDAALCDALISAEADLVLCAGYMKPIGSSVLSMFEGRIFNTHPSLLPKFGGKGMFGRHVHEAVLAAGESKSGATFHLVTERYDEGLILAQCRVPVARDDTPETLAARVQSAERLQVVRVFQCIAAFGPVVDSDFLHHAPSYATSPPSAS